MPFMKRFRLENPHENWTRRSVLAATTGVAACSGPPMLAQPAKAHPLWPVTGPPVLRGAVIAQRRRRIEVDGETFGGSRPALPAYGAGDFAALAEAGANLVVMSFPELWTVKPPFRRDTAMADILGQQLDAARAAGLHAVVALRSGPGRSDFVFHRDAQGSWFPANLIVDSIWTNVDEQAAWSEMCADIAKLIADRSEIAGLNVMVEPDPNVSGVNKRGERLGAWEPDQYLAQVSEISDWRRIAARCAEKVRSVSAAMPILISPPAFARTDCMAVMGEPPGPGVVWCVHDYEPREYTHSSRDSRGIPVFSEGSDETFAKRLEQAKTHGAPVFLGEFGAARWAHKIEDYYASRIATCEAQGAGWAAFRWPTSDAAYERSDDTFNLGWGPRDGDAGGAVLPTLRAAWKRNAVRPGAVLRGRN
jgi:hypothetical protein